ncbi:hypothetical protein EVAR_39015_1 [Eumeta japonica]|uniref:Uncharacterized protein n=1 Tax=Eumeta variegata TaxID=151549 RepID=A0A4C1WNJ8_EUMVA|nr:hypothetical protein EVAR_39015_1 [Eumeta japonica]
MSPVRRRPSNPCAIAVRVAEDACASSFTVLLPTNLLNVSCIASACASFDPAPPPSSPFDKCRPCPFAA